MATKDRSRLNQQRLRELLHYDAETGIFTRLVTTNNFGAKVGDIAGKSDRGRYSQICIDGRVYLSHRLAWLYITGEWPSTGIDHINGIGTDNRWSNLRLATQTQNMCNANHHSDNRAGFKGVTWDRARGMWQAQIAANKQHFNLGRFPTEIAAAEAYDAAAIKLHGSFARLNFPR